MPRGELKCLLEWLARWSLSAEALQGSLPERLRFLNALESQFDDIMAEALNRPLDWWHVRRELDIPLVNNPSVVVRGPPVGPGAVPAGNGHCRN
ncbi:MAG: hypothetical protein Q9O62_00285 [Ardenticatenia bacterium]|nr:hypothetical protein [Ardenticatenia bacterium]